MRSDPPVCLQNPTVSVRCAFTCATSGTFWGAWTPLMPTMEWTADRCPFSGTSLTRTWEVWHDSDHHAHGNYRSAHLVGDTDGETLHKQWYVQYEHIHKPNTQIYCRSYACRWAWGTTQPNNLWLKRSVYNTAWAVRLKSSMHINDATGWCLVAQLNRKNAWHIVGVFSHCSCCLPIQISPGRKATSWSRWTVDLQSTSCQGAKSARSGLCSLRMRTLR